MKKFIICTFMTLILIAVLAVPAVAEELSKQASVTVTEYINFTISDYGTGGINFGSQSAGSDNVSEADQNTLHGAVDLLVGSETNVDCSLQVKGLDDFDDGDSHTLLLSYAMWDTDNDVVGSTAMASSYAEVGTSDSGVSANVSLWHWLSIPEDQYAATYNTDFYYQAIQR